MKPLLPRSLLLAVMALPLVTVLLVQQVTAARAYDVGDQRVVLRSGGGGGGGDSGERPLGWSYRRYWYKPRPYRPLFVGKRGHGKTPLVEDACFDDSDCPSSQCCASLGGRKKVCLAMSQQGDMCFPPTSRTSFGCGCAADLDCVTFKDYEFGVCAQPFRYRR